MRTGREIRLARAPAGWMSAMIATLVVVSLAACDTDPERTGGAESGDGATADTPPAAEPRPGPDSVTAGPEPDPTEPGGGSEPASGPGAAMPGIELPELLARVDERGPDGDLRVLEEMLPPLRVEREAVQNRHDPTVTDTVRTLRWAGLAVQVYRPAQSGRDMIQSVTVTSDDYRTTDGLTVGSTRSEVRSALGEPLRRENGTAVHELTESEDDPTPTTLTISYEADYVQRLEWGFYVD